MCFKLRGMEHHKRHRELPEVHSDSAFRATPLFVVESSTDGPESPSSIARAPSRLHVSTPADVLAYIECTLGFAPRNSLTVVAFDDNKMSTVVRCDLPDALQQMSQCDTPESVTFMDFGMTEPQELHFIKVGRHIAELMAREPSKSSCLLIYTADEVTVSDQHALAVMGTANAVIAAQFGVQGIPVQQAWLIHHNMLWHLRCTATTECVTQGDTIDDPKSTGIYQALNPSRRVATPSQDKPRRLVFPPDTTVSSPRERDTEGLLSRRPQLALNWLTLWDKQLTQGPTMLHSDEVAQLLEAVGHPPIREALVATACFDLSTAIRGSVGLRLFPAQVAALAEVYGNMSDGATVTDALQGRSKRAPNWQRIAQLERLCHQLLPLSDATSGGVIAGIIVWIEWVRGRGSLAMNYVRQAREHFPAEAFLVMLEQLLEQGTVANWATRTDSAWSPQHAA